MTIKHIHTNQEFYLSYIDWKTSYIDRHFEENYEIVKAPDVVDLYLINPKNGNKTFIMSIDRELAIENYLKKNASYTIKETSAEFDELYRIKKLPDSVIYAEQIESKSTKIEMNKIDKVFISHSSKDREIVDSLIELIEFIGVSSEHIFCSSFPGYGAYLGEDFLERIKNELDNKTLVIFVLSQNFYASPVCLCEMGAAWIKSHSHIQILVPPFKYEDIKGVFPNSTGMIINNKSEINQLKEELERYFHLTTKSTTKWEPRRDKILKEIDEKLINNKTVSLPQMQHLIPYKKVFRGNFSSVDFHREIENAKVKFCSQNEISPSIIHFKKIRDTDNQLYVVNSERFVGNYISFEVSADNRYLCNLDCFFENNGTYIEIFSIQ